jgi:uncharacterized RDD family membrane protein YckC
MASRRMLLPPIIDDIVIEVLLLIIPLVLMPPETPLLCNATDGITGAATCGCSAVR